MHIHEGVGGICIFMKGLGQLTESSKLFWNLATMLALEQVSVIIILREQKNKETIVIKQER